MTGGEWRETMSLPFERMRLLRARSGLSMRAFAALLGSPLDTRYAYYEERRFTGLLPVDAARRIAAALQPHGVEPREVLALAGLSIEEADLDVAAQAPAIQYVRLDVALPNAEALTRMFETMLEDEVPAGRRDALARTLALRLPSALQRTTTSPPVPARESWIARGEDVASPARHHRPRRPGSHI
jgi:transcriptional regulator with XRE-family HTH domain